MGEGNERRYDEREAAQILARVAELGERQRDDAAGGLSQGELEEIAGEIGLDRALVARASAELAQPEETRALGGPTRLRFEARVPAVRSAAFLEEACDLLRRAVGDPGTLTETGGAQIWRSGGPQSRAVHLTVRQVGDQTLVRLEEKMAEAARVSATVGAAAGFVLAVFAMIPLKVLLGKPTMLLFVVPLFVLGLLGGWAAGRRRWRAISAARQAELGDLFRDLLDLAEADVDPTAPRQLGDGRDDD
jgi:tetrahydromethanopterin S-methyltransferase subunit F